MDDSTYDSQRSIVFTGDRSASQRNDDVENQQDNADRYSVGPEQREIIMVQLTPSSTRIARTSRTVLKGKMNVIKIASCFVLAEMKRNTESQQIVILY